jgi:hypothetical protein
VGQVAWLWLLLTHPQSSSTAALHPTRHGVIEREHVLVLPPNDCALTQGVIGVWPWRLLPWLNGHHGLSGRSDLCS